jgi:hypothetical protein
MRKPRIRFHPHPESPVRPGPEGSVRKVCGPYLHGFKPIPWLLIYVKNA